MQKILWLTLFVLAAYTSTVAQSCNPASVFYIVRDESGKVVSTADLASIAAQLPKTIRGWSQSLPDDGKAAGV